MLSFQAPIVTVSSPPTIEPVPTPAPTSGTPAPTPNGYIYEAEDDENIFDGKFKSDAEGFTGYGYVGKSYIRIYTIVN